VNSRPTFYKRCPVSTVQSGSAPLETAGVTGRLAPEWNTGRAHPGSSTGGLHPS